MRLVCSARSWFAAICRVLPSRCFVFNQVISIMSLVSTSTSNGVKALCMSSVNERFVYRAFTAAVVKMRR